VDGRERHEDVEVLTPHYRRAHLAKDLLVVSARYTHSYSLRR
jgi:hypothetical protein